jgi:hypothetical protein
MKLKSSQPITCHAPIFGHLDVTRPDTSIEMFGLQRHSMNISNVEQGYTSHLLCCIML